MSTEEQGSMAVRGLKDISDKELRETAEKAKNFPELKRMLGINPNEKNERVKKRAEKAGCEGLLEGYHVGKSSRVDGMSKEELQAIADECDTYSEFGKRLGYTDKSCCIMSKKIINKYNIEFCPKQKLPEYSKLDPKRYEAAYVQDIANESFTFVEMADKLGYKNPTNVRRLLEKLDIDYSHFDKDRHKRGTRYCLSDLKEDTVFNNKILRELLSSIGRDKCELCSCEDQWYEKELVLEVHHKNGDHYDNRIENLMLVCPTCHAYIEGKIGDISKRHVNSFEYEILKKRGHRCEECGNTEWIEGNIPLEIHHIDGNHRNNIPENVKLLCPNCHSQTKTFGCQQYVPPISDEEYVAALRNSKTIKQAIESLGKAVSGSTYKRAKKLIEQYKILHLLPLDELSIIDVSTAILNGEDLQKIQDKWGISMKELCCVINGTHSLSSSDFTYPLLESKTTGLEKKTRKRRLKVSSSNKPIKYCCDCNKPIFHNGERCQECDTKRRRKNLPTKYLLKNMIRNMSFAEIGRKYNVNGNAVVKWCRHYGLPWRKVDIDSFTDEEWEALEIFTDDMQKPRSLYDHDAVINILDKYHSAKYVSYLFEISIDAVHDIRRQRAYKHHMIEWSPTTCHIVDSDLYFRTTTDAGHWLAEHGEELKYAVPAARGKRVKRYIEQDIPLFGYQFEYVREEDYFGIIENHEVISYAYQEHREVPPQVKK